jgi:putative addiction module CopG family antidote
MQVRLSAAVQDFIRESVAEGRYPSADALISKAVKLLAQEELRAEIELGLKDIREGRVSDWDVEEEKQAFLRRLKRKKKAS